MADRLSGELRWLAPGDPDYLQTLRFVVAGHTVPDAETERRLNNLLEFIAQLTLEINPVAACHKGRRLVCACAAIVSPGRTALLYLPPDHVARRRPVELGDLIRGLQQRLWPQSLVIIQAMVPTESADTERVLVASGFQFLAELVYLERPVRVPPGSNRVRSDLTFVSYSPQRHSLFIDALERTYVDSLDCPPLTGLRQTEDVLATHRAAGIFNPDLWWVALADDRPVGVLLLSQVLRRPALEVVYMGVAADARQAGVGHALLARAVETCIAHQDACLTLAVDSRNEPAMVLYRQWGFAETGRRRAWIVSTPLESRE
jgi:GNAT superfamily N-acetyltransferase